VLIEERVCFSDDAIVDSFAVAESFYGHPRLNLEKRDISSKAQEKKGP